MKIFYIVTVRWKKEKLIKVMKQRKMIIFSLYGTETQENILKIIHKNYRLLKIGQKDIRYRIGFVLMPEVKRCVENVQQANDRIVGIYLEKKDFEIS